MSYNFAWRYRKYVIEAFNSDMPFDQFIAEQLAGDLLPAENPRDRGRQTIATRFLAIGQKPLQMQNILTLEMADEQLDVIGKAMLGQTITCARCHDHKFDPISAQDYYAWLAFC